jgi:hypothetical protein
MSAQLKEWTRQVRAACVESSPYLALLLLPGGSLLALATWIYRHRTDLGPRP